MNDQSGMSLVELLISLALSGIILLMAGHLYLAVSKAYLSQVKLTHQFQSLVYGKRYIKNLIETSRQSVCMNQPLGENKIDIIHADEVGQLAKLGLRKSGSGQIKRSTDVLIVSGVQEFIRIKEKYLLKDSRYFYFDEIIPSTLKSGKAVLISDCIHSQRNRIEKIIRFNNENKVILKHPIKYAFLNSYFGVYKQEVLYVGKLKNKPTQLPIQSALYQLDDQGRRQEIIAGLSNMQLKLKQGKLGVDLQYGNDKRLAHMDIAL